MFEAYIKPYLERFCSKVSVEQLCELIASGQDVYQSWIEEFSDGDRPPEIAYLFEDKIKHELKTVMAEVSPGHALLFEANPAWTERQLDGLLGLMR